MPKLCVHVCLHDYAESHKCLLTGDTKNKPPWLHELKPTQRVTVFLQKKQMGSINTLTLTCTSTDAPMHVYAPSTVSQAGSYLCKHKDLLCTL